MRHSVRTGSSPSNCFLSSRALSSSYENTKPVGLAGGALAPDCDWDRSSPADGVESLAIDPDPCPCCTQIHTLTSLRPHSAHSAAYNTQHAAYKTQMRGREGVLRAACTGPRRRRECARACKHALRTHYSASTRDCMPIAANEMPDFGFILAVGAFERCKLSCSIRKTQLTECSA